MNSRYPYLPEGRIIKYVPATDSFMVEARTVRDTMTTDAAHATGAVVVKEGKIVGRGANQSALKSEKLIALHKKGVCIRRLLGVPSGKGYWLCPGCSSPRHHAEQKAVKDVIARNGSTEGSDMYLYGHWWCCKPCWDRMIKAGIRNVYLAEGADELFKR